VGVVPKFAVLKPFEECPCQDVKGVRKHFRVRAACLLNAGTERVRFVQQNLKTHLLLSYERGGFMWDVGNTSRWDR
jgi:hypothetical protein